MCHSRFELNYCFKLVDYVLSVITLLSNLFIPFRFMVISEQFFFFNN